MVDRASGKQVRAAMLQTARGTTGEDESVPAWIAVIQELDVLEERGNLLDPVDDHGADPRGCIELPDEQTRLGFVASAEPAVLQVEEQRVLRRGAGLQQCGLPRLPGAEKEDDLVLHARCRHQL
jgi:hypothetical protein